MTKKVLIYFKENNLKLVGGPAGYLYNLRAGLIACNNLQKEKEVSFSFLKDNKGTSNNDLSVLKKIKWPGCLLEVHRAIRRYRNIRRILTEKSSNNTIYEYDAVHFHNSKDMYYERDNLKDYKGKVILNSHSPEPAFMELISDASNIEKVLCQKTYRKLIDVDKYAFDRADYIFWPCETADEPYEHLWNDYKNIKQNKIKRFKYVLSGTLPVTSTISREDFRKKYGIPQDAFCIAYIGRHSTIKGYDILKEIGKRLLDEFPNLYFLIAGKEYPISGLDHERWIELGWIDNPHSITCASDLFILPNRETYFDLVLLEALSVGISVVASRTGGNRFFDGAEGVHLFDEIEDCVDLISELIKEKSIGNTDVLPKNRDLYLRKFTVEQFAKGYIEAVNSVLTDG